MTPTQTRKRRLEMKEINNYQEAMEHEYDCSSDEHTDDWDLCLAMAKTLPIEDFPDGMDYEDIAEMLMTGDYDLFF